VNKAKKVNKIIEIQ